MQCRVDTERIEDRSSSGGALNAADPLHAGTELHQFATGGSASSRPLLIGTAGKEGKEKKREREES
jgi:hypothetical protein